MFERGEITTERCKCRDFNEGTINMVQWNENFYCGTSFSACNKNNNKGCWEQWIIVAFAEPKDGR